VRVKSRYRNSPIADTSPAVSRQPSLAEVRSESVADTAPAGDDASLAIQDQIDALNRSEQSERDRISFEKQMIALHPEQYRESVAAPPPTTRAPARDFFQPPAPRSERSASFVSAPVSREVPDSNYFAQRKGRIVLSPGQKEAARIAGVSEVVYAENIAELERRKAEGYYES
jgi:hypothetical protein